jgi:hypothetical protein
MDLVNERTMITLWTIVIFWQRFNKIRLFLFVLEDLEVVYAARTLSVICGISKN